MIDFVELQRIMKEWLERDRAVHSIEATGDTLELAVAAASTLLNVPIRRLEYEITERGFAGLFGAGKKEWKIRAYEQVLAGSRAKKDAAAEAGGETAETPAIVDVDGEAFVRLFADGAFLKVIPPQGNGAGVSEDAVMETLLQRKAGEIDRDLVSRTVKEAAGEYIRVGDYQRNAAADSILSIHITEGDMMANVTVSRPGPGGQDNSLENYIDYLHNNMISYGIKEDVIAQLVDRPVYGEPVTLAEGDKAVDGRDAYIQYNFETSQDKAHLRESAGGQVNFKDLNLIQNVVANQPLAVKVAAEKGKDGKNIKGVTLIASDGKDIPLPLGKNVHPGEDGITIFADINGQVLLVNNKINVEPVYTVDGGVNLASGNVIFLGTVVVNGDVEDGFIVKAAGNIEVNGTVEKAVLESEGNIIVTQGIAGKGGGIIKAGHSVWAKFVENAVVESGDTVMISEGIVNSQVIAANHVLCEGKRAAIVGGHVCAGQTINAKTLGNSSGTETVLEVGYDPRLKKRLTQLIEKKETIRGEIDELQRNIQTLVNIKRQQKKLPEDKEATLEDFMTQRQTLTANIEKAEEEITELQAAMTAVNVRGLVSASVKVHSGVRIMIRDVQENVRTDFKAVTFVLENTLIKAAPYEEIDKEQMKAPDGYTAN
ncbi:MAG: FapA family protein [Treponema sp.]|jgi:uncharacterized protein (DUF342 family)|nr:FapA family protein [Treponema sp.]